MQMRKSIKPAVLPEDNFTEKPDEEEYRVHKKALLPKIGKELPIPQELVGCTQALFFEFRHQTTSNTLAPYCLKPHDHIYKDRVYRSMYLIYISCDSEYEAAIKLLGNYAHWTKLKGCSWFEQHLEAWNAELLLREEALARSKLVDLTEKGNVTAARTLLNNKKSAPVGKPRRAPARKDDRHVDDIDDMLARTNEAGQQKH